MPAPVDAVVVGEPGAALLDELRAFGVRNVYALSGEAFGAYGGAAWAAGVDSVVSQSGSQVVLASGSPRGNEVMAHVAARRDVAMAANVIAVDSAADDLTVTRQVVGGAALEDMRLTDRPAVLTVAGHAVEPSPAAGAGTRHAARHRAGGPGERPGRARGRRSRTRSRTCRGR